MHELSLMEGVMDIVRDSAGKNQITRVKKIHLVIGKFSMVMPDSMHFCFDVLSQQEALFSEARLEIEERPIVVYCRECRQEFEINTPTIFICPGCGQTDIQMRSGREMYIESYEGEEHHGEG